MTGDDLDELLRSLGADPSRPTPAAPADPSAGDPRPLTPEPEILVDPAATSGEPEHDRQVAVGGDAGDLAGEAVLARAGLDHARRVDEAAAPRTLDEVDPVADGGSTVVGGGDLDGDGDDVDLDDEDDDEDKNRRSAKRALLDWLVVIVVSVAVAVGVRTFVLAHFVVDGTSMETTLDDGDRVFVNKLSYRLHDPNRGDVVVLHERSGATSSDLIKRVIGLPGEQVSMRSCTVYINDVALIEPYLDPEMLTLNSCGSDFGPTLVEDDHVFVMGDNRGVSSDSRALGTIPYDDLVGRAFVVFWPIGHMRWL